MISARAVREVLKRLPEGLPLLDPIEDMRISDDALIKAVKVRRCVARLAYYIPQLFTYLLL